MPVTFSERDATTKIVQSLQQEVGELQGKVANLAEAISQWVLPILISPAT
jgi:hypothetical protein